MFSFDMDCDLMFGFKLGRFLLAPGGPGLARFAQATSAAVLFPLPALKRSPELHPCPSPSLFPPLLKKKKEKQQFQQRNITTTEEKSDVHVLKHIGQSKRGSALSEASVNI